MKDHRKSPQATGSDARRAPGRPRNSIKPYRRAGGLAVLGAATALALATFGAVSSAHDAPLGKISRGGNRRARSGTDRSRARFAGTPASDAFTGLLEGWTTCERTNSHPNQAEPTVAHEVIRITAPAEAMPARDPNHAMATQFEYPNKACSQYLAGAQRAVAGGQPIEGWGDRAKYVEYANCMRANGYPTFPNPSAIEPDGHESTNFNGTGIDPESTAFLNGSANQTCGRQIGAPAWWINNWGPPGSVEVARPPIGPPPNGAKAIIAPGANGGPGATPGHASPAESSARAD